MSFEKIKWPLFFLLLGILSILAQVIILREITTQFYGNEMFYGLGLGLWMFFVGLGSLLAGRLNDPGSNKLPIRDRKKYKKKYSAISWGFLVILFLLFPLTIIALRWLVASTVSLGSIADFRLALLVSTIILFLFCIPLGVIFTLGIQAWEKKKTANRAYFWETIGFGIGGLVFSFFLTTSSFPLSKSVETATLRLKFPNIKHILNTRYNQIIVEEKNNQQVIYTNGQVTFSNKEPFESIKLLNLILPFTNSTRKILVFGDPNFARVFKENYPHSKVRYLEIDQKLLQFEKVYLGDRVETIVADVKRYLDKSTEKYDLIIFSPGNPQTLLTNRLFTKENFSNIKNNLSEDGIFTLLIYIPTDYRSQEAIKFSASIYQAFSHIFPENKLLSIEDQLLFIGTKEDLVFNNYILSPDWQEMIGWYLNDPRSQEILTEINSTQTKINTDLDPTSFFYQQLFWHTIFSFRLPHILEITAYLLPVLLLISLLYLLFKAKKDISLGTMIASSSFLLLSIEVVGIFLFQTYIGYLYSQIGMIFAGALVGMAVGIWFIEKVKKASKSLLQKSFLSYIAVFLLLVIGINTNFKELSIFWFTIIFITGVIGGIIYALINRIYLKQYKNLGFVYSFDLFGAALGAILTSSFFLPAFGLYKLILGLSLGTILIILVICRFQEMNK